MKGEIKGA